MALEPLVWNNCSLPNPGLIICSGNRFLKAFFTWWETSHKIVLKSLESLLLKHFLDKHGESMVFENLQDTSKEMLSQISNSPSMKSLDCGQSEQHILAYIDQYYKFRNETRNGSICKIAKYWAAYINHVWLELQMNEAVRRNDFLLYEECIHRMPDLFLSYDGSNYARYLTMYPA